MVLLRTTMYIINKQNSRYAKDCSPLQPICTLIDNLPAIAYFSYT